MAQPRWTQVDDAAGGIHHCISRCVRRMALLESPKRLEWLVARLAMLTSAFAIDACDFAAMINHLHLMLRRHPDLALAWDAEEVAMRWLTVMPNLTVRRALGIDADTPQPEEIAVACSDRALIAEWRWRLSNLGWFHRLLKEPCARGWNLVDKAKGHFWEGRYKCIPCGDENSLLVQSAYIVLNPVHCGRAKELDECEWTSLPGRMRQVEAEIRAGMHGEGRARFERALLSPALPCVPGDKVRGMADEEYSRRVAQGAWERAMREIAVDEAQRLRNEAERFAPSAIERGAKSAGQQVAAGYGAAADGSGGSGEAAAARAEEVPHPAARLLRSVVPQRPRQPAPRPISEMFALKTNHWRGAATIPLLERCTVEAFVDFADDCGRVERADKKGRIATDAPRATEKLRRKARAAADEAANGAGNSDDAKDTTGASAHTQASETSGGAAEQDWKDRLAPTARGLLDAAMAAVRRIAAATNALLGGPQAAAATTASATEAEVDAAANAAEASPQSAGAELASDIAAKTEQRPPPA